MLARPVFFPEPTGAPPIQRKSAGLRQILRYLAEPSDKPGHLLAQPGKTRPAPIVPLVHVDRTVYLDLQCVAALPRPPVMTGGETAGIRRIERNHKASLRQMAPCGLHDSRRAGGAVAIPENDIRRFPPGIALRS